MGQTEEQRCEGRFVGGVREGASNGSHREDAQHELITRTASGVVSCRCLPHTVLLTVLLLLYYVVVNYCSLFCNRICV